MRIVHKVCQHLLYHDAVNRIVPGRKKTYPNHEDGSLKCLECPGWERDVDYGKLRRGCYAVAIEYVNIVKYGNPWGRKYKNSRRDWPKKKGKKNV